MLWFKKKVKSAETLQEKQELKENKKAEKLAKKEYALQQKELQKNLKELQNSATALEPLSKTKQVIQAQPLQLPQLYQTQKVWQFIPITLLIYDCLNDFCLQKLLQILHGLPKNSEVYLEYPYLVDNLQATFIDLHFKELKNRQEFPSVEGHFIASIQLTTVDVPFLLRTITKIYQDTKEVYLFYYDCFKLSIYKDKDTLALQYPIKKDSTFTRHSHFMQTTDTEYITALFHTFLDIPYFCLDKLFLIYTKHIAQKILPLENHLSVQYKSNFLPLLLSQNIAFLENLPAKHASTQSIKDLEEDIKNYLKLYKVYRTQIVQECQHLFFYRVIESKLLQYYAQLIVENRLDRLEKFDSALQKKYFVFYIGLAEHSFMRYIQKLRKKGYRANFLIKFFAKQTLALAQKACKS